LFGRGTGEKAKEKRQILVPSGKRSQNIPFFGLVTPLSAAAACTNVSDSRHPVGCLTDLFSGK
jgi:hypothetical protein